MFGDIPATGFFLRHIRNLEMSNVEIATETSDARPAFWLKSVESTGFFPIRVAAPAPAFDPHEVTDFHHFGSQFVSDLRSDRIETQKL